MGMVRDYGFTAEQQDQLWEQWRSGEAAGRPT
jgi:hypothetical protein